MPIQLEIKWDFFWDSELFTQDSSLKDTQQTSRKVFQRESQYVSASVYSKECAAKPSQTVALNL